MTIPFAQIDAFADRPFTGNPAAVMMLDDWLDDATLRAIAAENNLSETAFLVPDATDGADYHLRWFTPASEVVLCGHATLASGHWLLGQTPDRQRVRFRTRYSGTLQVTRDGDGYALDLPAWRAARRPLPAIVAALGLAGDAETYWHPHRYGLIVLGDEAAVRAVEPDFRALALEGDVLTIVTAPGTDTDIVSRAFAPGAGIDEDPVTGSAHAVLTPYWCDRLGRDRFTAYQASRRGGRLSCRLVPATDAGEDERVVLGSRCVTVIEGSYRI